MTGKDERSVFGPQSIDTKRAKEDEEVREISSTEPSTIEQFDTDSDRNLPPDRRVISAAEKRRSVRALLKEAEELAFKRLSSEYGEKIYRNVTVSGAGKDIAFDGVIFEPPHRFALIEVKLIRSVRSVRNLISPALSNALAVAAHYAANNYFGAGIKRIEFILVLVTDGEGAQQQEEVASIAWQTIDSQSALTPTLRMFDLDELRRMEEQS